jgi:hypothetical protein
VVIRGCYAVLLECRDAMVRWGLPPVPRQQVHAQVRLRLVYASDAQRRRAASEVDVTETRNGFLNPHVVPLQLTTSLMDG